MQTYTTEKKIEIFKKMANFLSDKTFPKCKISEDMDIAILKTTDIVYDGFSCGIYFSNSIFENYKIKILQAWSKYHSFLPTNIVFNLGLNFLLMEGFYFFEIWNGDKVIYCLVSVVDKENKIVSNFYKGKQKEKYFNGIRYYQIDTPEVNII